MFQDYITFTITVFLGFFAIMNPITNTTIFVELVEGYKETEKKKIAKTASITAFFIVFLFIVLGKYIFEVFGITIPAFKITGGILIFFVGFEMIQSKKSKVHSNQAIKPDDGIAISPLAIPIMAGPGTIVTALNYVTHADYFHITIVVVTFAVMITLTYLCYQGSDLIVKKLGKNLITVFGKIMGFILAIMGTDMVINGVKLSFNL